MAAIAPSYLLFTNLKALGYMLMASAYIIFVDLRRLQFFREVRKMILAESMDYCLKLFFLKVNVKSASFECLVANM